MTDSLERVMRGAHARVTLGRKVREHLSRQKPSYCLAAPRNFDSVERHAQEEMRRLAA